MLRPVFGWLAGCRLCSRAGSVATIARRGACSALVLLALAAPAQAIPTIMPANGVTNPPSSLSTTALSSPQTAIPDTATLVPTIGLLGTLQAVLDAQGFSNADNWSLVANAVTLANNATFTLVQYNLFLNPGGNNQDGGLPIGTPAGSAFGEGIRLALDPNLAGPANVTAGSTATIHWLQLLNEDKPYNGFGFPITGLPGFWQFDNGDISGGAATGPATGPYYDSFAPPGAFPVPPCSSIALGSIQGLAAICTSRSSRSGMSSRRPSAARPLRRASTSQTSGSRGGSSWCPNPPHFSCSLPDSWG